MQEQVTVRQTAGRSPGGAVQRPLHAAGPEQASFADMRADLGASRKIEKQLRGQIKVLQDTLDASKHSEKHAKQRCTSMMDALRRVQSEKRAASDGVEAAQNRASVQQRSIASLQSRLAALEAALAKVCSWGLWHGCVRNIVHEADCMHQQSCLFLLVRSIAML
jgi:hypothetical protein